MTRTDPLHIRDARENERDALTALTRRVYAEYATIMSAAAWAELDRAVRSALASDAPVERIVAERDDVLVGGVHLYPPAAAAYGVLASAAAWPELRLLAVSPDARGAGVGEALVHECIRRARAAGHSALGLHTSASMAAAKRMYERMGFVRVPEYDFQPGGAELVMGYVLHL